ncbi:MAG TPA: hypothetical protein VIV60_25485, partial [Polyangiaceae bacterium]
MACGCRATNDSRRDEPGKERGSSDVGPSAAARDPSGVPKEAFEPPELLYLPDGGDVVTGGETWQPAMAAPVPPKSSRCPAEMVDVEGEFCIDRYEAQLADQTSGELLSP